MDIVKAKENFSRFRSKDFRLGQAEVIEAILQSDKKVVVVSAPTGSGKSLIGMAAGATHDRFCYLCSSKQLQRQLAEDFPEAKHMMGRSNFPCNQDPKNRTADMCIHTPATPCDLKSVCDYELHKRAVLQHGIQILNYHYFLNEANYIGQFSDYEMVICDEADVLEGLLTGFVELRLSKSKLDSLNIPPPKRKTSTASDGLVSWKKWAENEASAKVTHRLERLRAYLATMEPDNQFSDTDSHMVREYKSLKAVGSKIEMFTRYMDSSWIFQEHKGNGNGFVNRWTFQPTWLTPELSHQYFFRHGEKFVLMSATFPPRAVLAEMLGIGTGDIEYIEMPSTFPVGNRPVLLDPVADMSYKTFSEGLPKLLQEISRILQMHPNEKGIVHTINWRLNAAVMGIGDPRLISHNSRDKEYQLERFMMSDNGVFVSPSSTRGVDLPDDDCRFVIVCKAPFQSLGDKLVSSRVHGSGLGAFWYRAICAQDILQASGRGVRHKGDYCTTYLLDSQIEKIVVDNQNLFPRYWMESVDYMGQG